MKRMIVCWMQAALFSLILLVGSASCSTDDPILTQPEPEQTVPPVNPDEPDGSDNLDEPGNNDDNNPDDNNPMSNNLKISIGSSSFNATLEDNATVTAFKALLPMTVSMSEMNGNEKYYYLQGSLPTASSNPGTIRTGDLMLYGSSCVVLFYETFSTSYSYTRLGRVDNPSGLASALGSGNVTVTFELQ
ncbi:cyclophilin-like fold protein [Bacteroides sp.]